jgi:hypothetical protein
VSIPDAWVVVGLVLAIVDQVRARGQAITTWAVIAVCIALLWHLT